MKYIAIRAAGVVFCTMALLWSSASVSGAMLHHEPRTTLAETCSAIIPFGALIDCSISVTGEVDTYTFSATTNDTFIVRMARTSGTLFPDVNILNASGVSECDASTYDDRVGTVCTAKSTGQYTLEVRSYGDNATGDYQLYMQKLNGVGNATPISFGSAAQGNVAASIESKTYTFTAEQNDLVRLRLHRTGGDFYPRFRVYNQSGAEVCADSSYGALAVRESCAMTAAGTYAILVDDIGAARTGTYDLHLQRLNNPGATTAIQLGTVADGELGLVAEMDVYSITAAANDQMMLRLVKVSGAFNPRIVVFNSGGARICERSTYGAVVSPEPCPIPADGTYNIFIDDLSRENTGAYKLHFQRRNSPGNAAPIAFGQTLNGAIESIAAIKSYTFEGVAGSQVRLTLQRTAGDFEPSITVYNPSGIELCTRASFSDQITLTCALETSGLHTIIVDDQGTDSIGTYNLTLACLSGRCGPAQVNTLAVYLPLTRR